MSELWYEANTCNHTIKEVVVVKESVSFVTLQENQPMRTKKTGGHWTYHKTWDEAWEELYAQAMAKQLRAESMLTSAIKTVKAVEGLK